jgi:uncharacterized protein (DUF305 family)
LSPIVESDDSLLGRWKTAAYLGLISSTFSTLASQLSAARIGRDAAVDWMSVAAIPARDWALSSDPTAAAIAIGIVFHQWADFSRALLFFGGLGRWTAKLRPISLALLALPWAILTSALEWLVLVPIFPFWQPIFTLQQPYWIGFLVHLTSASMYPFYAWLRASPLSSKERHFLQVWAAGAATGLVALSGLALFATNERELPWLGRDPQIDQTFIRHMSTHHEQGITLASIAAKRATDGHLRALAGLMAASQTGEMRLLGHFWLSWFGSLMQICSSQERATMPGLLDPAELDRLREVPSAEFESLFVKLMTVHHAGAVKMADDEFRDGSDPVYAPWRMPFVTSNRARSR